MNSHFAIIAQDNDLPLFEAKFPLPVSKEKSADEPEMSQFILHASLDMLERVQWSINQPYLQVIDRYGEWHVSAYIAPCGERFLLLHKIKGGLDDGQVKQFFTECSEIYYRHSINPFFMRNRPIESSSFSNRIYTISRRYFK
jgi:hypothetical protein